MGYETDVSTQLLRVECALCGTPVRRPESLERGWGAECDKKMGGAGSARVWAQMEHDFDLREATEALMDAPTLKPTRWMEAVINPRTGAPEIERVFKKDDELPDGSRAQGGEVLTKAEPLNVPGLKAYWKKIGGPIKNGTWRTDPEVRRAVAEALKKIVQAQ